MAQRRTIDFAQRQGTLQHITGDLTRVNVAVVAQQTNCWTRRCHGLALTLKRELGVDSYGAREGWGNKAQAGSRSTPGTVEWHKTAAGKDDDNERPKWVANLMAQWAPGKAGHYPHPPPPQGVKETKEVRHRWFSECLEKLSEDLSERFPEATPENPVYIAFPEFIGCGLAGGKWSTYKEELADFAAANDAVRVVIVAWERRQQ